MFARSVEQLNIELRTNRTDSALRRPERNVRLDLRRAPSRNPRGAERDQRQAETRRDERDRVERRDFEEEALEEARQQHRAGDAEHETASRQQQSLAEYTAENSQLIGTERHPDPELPRAFADREGEHAADANRRNRQRQYRKAAEQRRVQPRRRDALGG